MNAILTQNMSMTNEKYRSMYKKTLLWKQGYDI
jgi:hypothetical protein